MARIVGGEVLVRSLRAHGIDTIFSISDIGQSPMLAGAEAAGMRHVGPRHESAAVHMADAYARSSGRIAAVAGAAGPGVANMVPGLMCAWMEGVPLLALGTQRVRQSINAVRRGRFQFGPQLEVVRPVTKFAGGVDSARRIPEFVAEAVRHARDGRPGPSYLDLPSDVLLEPVDEADITIHDPQRALFAPGTPDAAMVSAAADLLVGADRPLVLAGHGVHRGDAADALREVAERTGASVMTTAGARGAFPEDHPQSVGMIFPWGTPAHLESDVILAVGTQLGESTQFLMPPGWAGPDTQKVIHLDADPVNIGVNRDVDIALVGDARAGLQALADELEGRGDSRAPSEAASTYAREYQDFRRGLQDSYLEIDMSPVHPGRLMVEAARALPDDAMVSIDGGNTGLWVHMALTVNRPRSLLWTGHYGHLGTGLPYAMGAKIANPDRPSVLLSGDGAFGFNIQELETAAREEIDVVAVINCDYAWGMEEVYMQKTANTTVGVKHSEVRYDRVAEALGCHAEFVDDPSDLRSALDRALTAGRPSVVQVVVNDRENINPPGLDDFVGMYSATTT
ncbi:MAG: thiamine pyrophosphate-binding protein [Acidimicrobiia bacterium]